jgi:phenylacetate-CoA ligase
VSLTRGRAVRSEVHKCWNPDVETAPLEEIRELQLRKLREQLRDLPGRSPFYREKFKQAGFKPERLLRLDDLEHAPFTTKTELRESQVAAPPLGSHAAVDMTDVIRIHSSSGTTGRPSYMGLTLKDRDAWMEILSRVYWCQGVRQSDVFVHGFALGFFVGGLPVKDAIENIGAAYVPVGTGASDRVLTSIRDLQGTVLTATPSYALYLVEFARERFGIEPVELGLRRIALGAEPGGAIPAVRERIEREWGVIATEALGNSDVAPAFAATCDAQDGNHFVAPDHLYLELIDPETEETIPWDDGAEGELVATHLERDCVPLVRFRVADRVRVSTGPCPCGRTGPRMVCVGRTDEMLIVAGVNVWPSAVKDVVEEFHPRTTGALQILLPHAGPQLSPPLRLQVEYGDEVSDLRSLKTDLEQTIRAKLIVKTDIELVPPETLPRFEMKAQLVRKLYD